MLTNLNTLTFVICNLLIGGALAQGVYDCSSAPGISFNQTELLGTWYQVTRTPEFRPYACIKVDYDLLRDIDSFKVNISHTFIYDGIYRNETRHTVVELLKYRTGYNIFFTRNNVTESMCYIKLLEMYSHANQQWIAGCGFSNAADPRSSYAFLLTRSKNVAHSDLLTMNNVAAQSYSDFKIGNYAVVQQEGCYKNTAAATLSMMTSIIAMIYMLFNVF